MRASGIDFSLALVLFAASVANAAPPAAPQVTLGADLKVLRFDWEPVAGATFYQVRISPTGSSVYRPLGETIPASTTQVEVPIAVHLQDWVRTRYILAACNSDGCTNSAALNPRSLMLDAIGYLKASNSEREDAFGQGMALSADGYTLAVSAWFESSNASGVNGDQTNNLSQHSGAVYVFRRRGNTWHQEAYLKAGTNQPAQSFGSDFFLNFDAMALSADGSMLAAAASREDANGVEDAGAVYVFRRIQNVWSLMTKLHAPQPLAQDFFGTSVDMSHDGRTLKVTSVLPLDDLGNPEMSTHLFVRPANTWQFCKTLAPLYPGDLCQSSRLSGDGQTLVFSCGSILERHRLVTMKRSGNAWKYASELQRSYFLYLRRQPIALNRQASVMALSEGGTGLVGIYRWNGANWSHEAELDPPPIANPYANFGYELALSDSGQLLAIGNLDARQAGAGISPSLTSGTAILGAVFLYQRKDDTGTWALRNVVKSPRPGFKDWFGLSVALSASGRTLAVGAPGENSNATGIDGERENEHALNSGAAYLY